MSRGKHSQAPSVNDQGCGLSVAAHRVVQDTEGGTPALHFLCMPLCEVGQSQSGPASCQSATICRSQFLLPMVVEYQSLASVRIQGHRPLVTISPSQSVSNPT